VKQLLIIPFLLTIQFVAAQTPPLFKISENDRIGYIDNKGKVVIPPVFRNGSDFAEGLAAVRRDGFYGYIDGTGKFALAPVYDYAEPFAHGIARVYKAGVPLFINKSGATVLPTVYGNITFLKDGKVIATTLTDKQGILDIHSQKLIIDTLFSNIQPTDDGAFVVTEYLPPFTRGSAKLGLLDTTGAFLVPSGKYDQINSFYDGLATVHKYNEDRQEPRKHCVIDAKGNLVFERVNEKNTYINGDFHDGYARISLYKKRAGDVDAYVTGRDYPGFINLKGEVVYNDTMCLQLTDFSYGRAFVRKKKEDYILVDRNFKQVGQGRFGHIFQDKFHNGYAIVETRKGYGIIDTSGNFIVEPAYGEIDWVGIIDDYFFFVENREPTNDHEDGTFFGIADLTGKEIMPARMQNFDRTGFQHGLLKAVIANALTYIDRNGSVVWQEKLSSSALLKRLNIDYMYRGYFTASSSPGVKSISGYGGWGSSGNIPQKNAKLAFLQGRLAVIIDTTRVDTFQQAFSGFTLFVSNNTSNTVVFNAQNSRLYMTLQAKNNEGLWQDIEYLPSSWCGNSYHDVSLKPKTHWRFVIPAYEGAIATKIRARLKYVDNNNKEKELEVYSNEINGSINPGQFFNKMPYAPKGIMDPYSE